MTDLIGEPSVPQGAVQRLVAILTALQQDGPTLGLSEIARKANLPISTTRRFLLQLCEAKLLERQGNDYQIGIGFFEIGMKAPFPKRLRQLATSFMDDLHSATEQNVHLGILDDKGVLVIEQRAGRKSVRNPVNKNIRLPAHATANGKCLLAFSQPSRVERLLAQDLRQITPHTVTCIKTLEEQLEEIRQRGWSLGEQENSLGTISVGTPIFGADGYAIAALSLVVPSTTKMVKPYAHAVKTTATTITRLWNQQQLLDI